jgi:hypothetical protein
MSKFSETAIGERNTKDDLKGFMADSIAMRRAEDSG